VRRRSELSPCRPSALAKSSIKSSTSTVKAIILRQAVPISPKAHHIKVKKGDVQSLHSYLKSLGIWDDDCDELCDALKAEVRPKQSGLMGPKVGVDWKDGCKGSVGFMGRVPSYRARITHKGDFCILRLGVNWIRAA